MFYEFMCLTCNHPFLLRRPMNEAALPGICPKCNDEAKRIISLPSVHMNEWVAEGYRRTNELPDDLKPGVKRIQDEKNLVSYPGQPAKRKKAMQ